MKLIKTLMFAWALSLPAVVYASPTSMTEACGCDVCPMSGCPCC